MTTQTVKVKHDGMTLAFLIWITLGRQPQGFIERVLDMNPGVSGQLVLPVGKTVILPVEEVSTQKAVPLVRLWD
jgi:phage tail protein X